MKFSITKLLSPAIALGLLLLAGCANDASKWAPGKETIGNTVAVFQIGDDVTVALTGPPGVDLAPHEETVKEDGTITMPQIGKIKCLGKTPGQVQDAIRDLYVPAVYTQINVSVKSGDRIYYVRGEVRQPGRQIYLGDTTVTKAIASAGDFTDYADRNKVWLTRSNGQRFWEDCREALDHPEMDAPVYPGDQIEVKRSLW